MTMTYQSKRDGGWIKTGLRVAAMTAAALLALSLSPAALAQHRGGGGGGAHFGGHSGGFSGGRSGFVTRGGGFARAGHGGGHFRGAVVIGGGLWYPAAVYPYPYYAYPYGYPYAYPYAYEGAPAQAYNMPPPAQNWYYCDSAAAYYPYVTTCPGGWREVAPTPPQPGTAPAQ
jgi:hypothetical protein